MPSDQRVAQALDVLGSHHEAFRAAVGTTAEQLAHYLAEAREPQEHPGARVALELGPFAANRIDPRKFSALFDRRALPDRRAVETVEHARAALADLANRDRSLVVIDVEPGGDLEAAVASAFETIGRAFAAARTFEKARAGSAALGKNNSKAIGGFPFDRWSRGERRRTPPLIIAVDGADLRVAGLSAYLDGSVKLVLVVRGDAPPAPLVRAITPGTLVLQSPDPADLSRLATWEGPGIAALMPEGPDTARFIHDPRKGERVWERLTIEHLPPKPVAAIGGMSRDQQAEELAQLAALGARPPAPTSPDATVPDPALAQAATPAATAPADPVDKLAAWLLSQADLTDLDG